MRLTVAGCTGSMSGPASSAAAYLVQAEDAEGRTWSVGLDLGPGGFGQLMRYVDPRELDALFFSHLHPDHMADVTSLQVYLRYHPEGESGPLLTYGPERTAERISAVCWIEDWDELKGQFDVHEYTDGEAVEVGPLRVVPFRMRHPVPAYGLRVEGPSAAPGHTAAIAYTGDTDSCPAAARLADGVDLLLCEASFQEGREDDVRDIHLTGLRAGELAAAVEGGEWEDPQDPDDPPELDDDGLVHVRKAAGLLVLTHLPPWTDPETVLAEARSVYKGPIDVAATGSTWTV